MNSWIRHQINDVNMRRIDSYSGVTMLEILIAVTVITICFIPVFSIFSMSHRMSASGKNLNRVVRLANNLMSGLKSLDASALPILDERSDDQLPGSLDLETLGISKSPSGFRRYLTISKVEDALLGADFHQIFVDVKWISSVSDKELVYRLSTVVESEE
ncbi:hypothetical protein HOF92_00255 [bacterium]|nr:hypothetical protein [bacterium]